MIFKDSDEKYGFTGPVVGDEDGVNPFDGSAPIPGNTKEVGYWHTHGEYSVYDENNNIVRTGNPSLDDFNSDNFSPPDISVANYRGKESSEYKGYVSTPGNIFRGYDAKIKKQYILEKPKNEDN